VRVTRKGQVTIPQQVRAALGIAPGSQVEITARGDHAEIRLAGRLPTRGELIARRLEGSASGGLSSDELMALTRGEG